MKHLIWFAIFLTACSAAPTAAPMTPSHTPPPTDRPTLIASMPPTQTPRPTSTPMPTSTPTETPTPTPPPEPIIIEGQGDQVLEIDKWAGMALLDVVYQGEGNFVVYNYDREGERIDLLVNEIGAYRGLLLIDYNQRDHATTRLQVKADGEWSITLSPPTGELRHSMTEPGAYAGQGSDVVFIDFVPDLITVHVEADDNFVIRAANPKGEVDLIVNEIGPYDGQGVLPVRTTVLVIEATGAWSIDVTGR